MIKLYKQYTGFSHHLVPGRSGWPLMVTAEISIWPWRVSTSGSWNFTRFISQRGLQLSPSPGPAAVAGAAAQTPAPSLLFRGLFCEFVSPELGNSWGLPWQGRPPWSSSVSGTGDALDFFGLRLLFVVIKTSAPEKKKKPQKCAAQNCACGEKKQPKNA